MTNKTDWTKNATFLPIKGTQLHIIVELDPDKVQTLPLPRFGREQVSSTEDRLDTPFGPVIVNVSVRTLKAGGRAA